MNLPPKKDPNEIVHHASGGMSITGRDAMNLYRAITLVSSMKLYAKTGIRPTRGVGPKQMLMIAKEYTGKDYPNSTRAMLAAIDDVQKWVDTMKPAIPVTDNRCGGKE